MHPLQHNPTPGQVDLIITAMKNGLTLHEDDFFEGEARSYEFKDGGFLRTRMDTVVGSYFHEEPLSEQGMRAELAARTIGDLRSMGANVDH